MIRARHILTAFALAAVALCCAASEPRLCEAATPAEAAHAVCGLWQAGAAGALFRVEESATPGCFDLTVVDSPDYTMRPGTVFGTMKHTGTPHTFDASLMVTPEGSYRKSTRLDYIIEYSPQSATLTFRHYNRNRSINALRMLPYLFRISVSRTNARPEGIDAAHRISVGATPNYVYL